MSLPGVIGIKIHAAAKVSIFFNMLRKLNFK